MAKHNNKNRYPVKESIGEDDYIVGEDGLTKKTVNFKGSAFASSIDQENILKPIFTKTALGKTINQAVDAINGTALFTKAEKEQIYFRVPRNLVTIVNGGGASEGTLLTNQQLHYDYYLLQNKGKGTYGVGGAITVTAGDILLFKTTEVYNITSSNNLPPVVYQLQTDNILTPPENILNNAPRSGGFDVTNDADFFFEVREIDQSVVGTTGTPPVFTGQFALYRWVGDEGNYGLSGTDNAVSNDFELVELKEINVTIDDFLSLIDVVDSSYNGKLGQVPMVSYDPFSLTEKSALPNVPAPPLKLKLTKLPQFTDIYKKNALIRGGVIPLGGLSYKIWATEYVIDNVYYNIPVSQNVTLSNGGAEPRIDVYALRVSLATEPSTVSAVVIEGTESATPVKPTVDLTKEVEVSFKLLLAGETTDPDVENELVFNENTGESGEWDNLYLVLGANLADTSNPFLGSSSFKIPQSVLADVATENKVSWINDSKYTYDGQGNLVFALKTNALWGRSSSLDIKLIDSDNPTKFWKISLTSLTISNYGFDTRSFDWKLLSIPMSDFIALTRSQSEFDTIEFKFNSLPETSLDWINIQKGMPKPELQKTVLKVISSDSSVEITEYEPQKFDIKIPDLSLDLQAIIDTLRDGVPTDGDTLNKLYVAIQAINILLTSDEANLDTIQEIVDYIQINREDLENLNISAIAGLQSALDAKALDSEVVKLTGNQTVAGIKTFSIVPSSSQDASAPTDLVRKSQHDLKSDLSDTVRLTTNQNVAGKKSFSTVPASSQDASSANDLVRYSQMESAISSAEGNIPLTVYTANACYEMPDKSLSRWIYNGASGGEFCLLPDVTDDGKEIIFTNMTNNTMVISVSSALIYNFVYAGSGVPYSTIPARGWFRARVMLHSGTPYFMITESGVLGTSGESI